MPVLLPDADTELGGWDNEEETGTLYDHVQGGGHSAVSRRRMAQGPVRVLFIASDDGARYPFDFGATMTAGPRSGENPRKQTIERIISKSTNFLVGRTDHSPCSPGRAAFTTGLWANNHFNTAVLVPQYYDYIRNGVRDRHCYDNSERYPGPIEHDCALLAATAFFADVNQSAAAWNSGTTYTVGQQVSRVVNSWDYGTVYTVGQWVVDGVDGHKYTAKVIATTPGSAPHSTSSEWTDNGAAAPRFFKAAGTTNSGHPPEVRCDQTLNEWRDYGTLAAAQLLLAQQPCSAGDQPYGDFAAGARFRFEARGDGCPEVWQIGVQYKTNERVRYGTHQYQSANNTNTGHVPAIGGTAFWTDEGVWCDDLQLTGATHLWLSQTGRVRCYEFEKTQNGVGQLTSAPYDLSDPLTTKADYWTAAGSYVAATRSCGTTNNSTTVTCATATSADVGRAIAGTNIQAGTTVISQAGTNYVIAPKATGTATNTMTFGDIVAYLGSFYRCISSVSTAASRTCTTHGTTNVLCATASTGDIGSGISGTDIPGGATITAAVAGVSYTISIAATGSHTSTLAIAATPVVDTSHWTLIGPAKTDRFVSVGWERKVISADDQQDHYRNHHIDFDTASAGPNPPTGASQIGRNSTLQYDWEIASLTYDSGTGKVTVVTATPMTGDPVLVPGNTYDISIDGWASLPIGGTNWVEPEVQALCVDSSTFTFTPSRTENNAIPPTKATQSSIRINATTSAFTSTPSALHVGAVVSGTNIVGGTKIAAVAADTVRSMQTQGTTTVLCGTATNAEIGCGISGAGIPAGATITGCAPTTSYTISIAATNSTVANRTVATAAYVLDTAATGSGTITLTFDPNLTSAFCYVRQWFETYWYGVKLAEILADVTPYDNVFIYMGTHMPHGSISHDGRSSNEIQSERRYENSLYTAMPGSKAWNWPSPTHPEGVNGTHGPDVSAGEAADTGHQQTWYQRQNMFASQDDSIGALLDQMDAKFGADTYYVVMVDDNGMQYGGHNFGNGLGNATEDNPWSPVGGKIYLWENSVRVSFFIKGPGFGEGATSTQLVELADIPMTILRMFEGAVPELVGHHAHTKRDGMAIQDKLAGLRPDRHQFCKGKYKEHSVGGNVSDHPKVIDRDGNTYIKLWTGTYADADTHNQLFLGGGDDSGGPDEAEYETVDHLNDDAGTVALGASLSTIMRQLMVGRWEPSQNAHTGRV